MKKKMIVMAIVIVVIVGWLAKGWSDKHVS